MYPCPIWGDILLALVSICPECNHFSTLPQLPPVSSLHQSLLCVMSKDCKPLWSSVLHSPAPVSAPRQPLLAYIAPSWESEKGGLFFRQMQSHRVNEAGPQSWGWMSSHRAQPQQLYTAALPTPCNSSPLALPKQSQLLPPLCSEPHKSLPDSVLPRPSAFCHLPSYLSDLLSYQPPSHSLFFPQKCFLAIVKYPRPIFTSGSLLTVCLLKLQRSASNIQVTGSLISLMSG